MRHALNIITALAIAALLLLPRRRYQRPPIPVPVKYEPSRRLVDAELERLDVLLDGLQLDRLTA